MDYACYIRHLVRPHLKRLIVALVAAIGIMAVDVGSPLIIALLVDMVIERGEYHLLAPLMLAFLTLPFVAGVCRCISDYLMALIGQRFILDIRRKLYYRVQRLSCDFLYNTTTGKVLERLRGDVQQLQVLLTEQTPTLIVQTATGLVMILVMFFFSPRLTLLVLVGVGLYVVNYKWFVGRIRRKQRIYRRKMDSLSSVAQEQLAGGLVVRSFGNERSALRHFIQCNFLSERALHRYRVLNNLYSYVASFLGWGCYLLVLLVGTYFVVMGQLTFGAVMAMTAFTMRLIDPALKLAELSNQIQQAKVSFDRIFELMEAEADTIDQPGIRKSQPLRGEVAFENVCFDYKPATPVLRYFNLHVQPGQTVALVGQTGCGKTTITSLLYRFYEPQAGHLEIDGHDITQYDTRWYRRQLALVPQHPIVFDTTIAENIAYGRSHAKPHEIKRAARMAALGDLIKGLPRGIDTPLGEYGLSLSIGEKQRLCIARALLANPAILIFDEATSSLDAHSEAMIQLALHSVRQNRTCFVIAHRLSTITTADLIVVMDDGRVVETGNHNQLMQNPQGRYRQLFVTQSRAATQALEAVG